MKFCSWLEKDRGFLGERDVLIFFVFLCKGYFFIFFRGCLVYGINWSMMLSDVNGFGCYICRIISFVWL